MLFHAGRQLIKVRFLVVFCLVCGIGLCWFGWDILLHYGLREADGGVLAPLTTRVLFGGLLVVLGLFVAIGMVLFAQLAYVRQIDILSDGRARITLAGVITSPVLEFERADLKPLGYHDGYLPTWGVTVNAPWYTVRNRHRRLPLIVDVQGKFNDRAAFWDFFAGESDDDDSE